MTADTLQEVEVLLKGWADLYEHVRVALEVQKKIAEMFNKDNIRLIEYNCQLRDRIRELEK